MSKYLYALIVFGGLIFFSCTEENVDFGTDLVDDISIQFEETDTLSIVMSTVKFDTLVTSNINRILVGKSVGTENRPGELEASGFLQLGSIDPNLTKLRQFGTDDDASAFVFDSLTFNIISDNYKLGDSTQPVTYNIYQLSEEIEFYEDEILLYQSSSFDFDSLSPLGSLSVIPVDAFEDTIVFRLSDSFGKTLFDTLSDRTSEEFDPGSLQEYLKGFVITTDQSHDFIAGFRLDGFEMVLHYHDTTVIEAEVERITFDINRDASSTARPRELYFSKFDRDFSGTEIEGLSSFSDNISTEMTKNVGFIAAGRGLAVRIEIPTLNEFFAQTGDTLLGSSILSIRPEFFEGTEPADTSSVWTNLDVFKVDGKNRFLKRYSRSNTVSVDQEFDVNTSYSIDISDFISEQKADFNNNNNAILLNVESPAARQNMESIVIGDGKNKELKANILINIIKRKDE